MSRTFGLISVGISTYNRKDYLQKSIESIQKQTFRDFEIIVIDDGSQDGTGDMIKEKFPDIRYYYQENQGDAAAKNNAAAHARGKYIVFNDSDDMFLPDALERLYQPLKGHPDACSYGQALTIDPEDRVISTKNKMKTFPSGDITPDLIRHIIVNNCATLMPLKLFRHLPGYDTRMRCAYDYKLNLEMSTTSKFYAVPGEVFLRRRHDSNISSASYKKINIILRVLEDFFTKHPDIRQKYSGLCRRRIADIHIKLAREARKEKLSTDIIRKHLKISMQNAFSWKALFRHLTVH